MRLICRLGVSCHALEARPLLAPCCWDLCRENRLAQGCLLAARHSLNQWLWGGRGGKPNSLLSTSQHLMHMCMVREASAQAQLEGGRGWGNTTTASLLPSTTNHLLPCTGPELCDGRTLAAAQLTQQGQVRVPAASLTPKVKLAMFSV